MDLLIGAADLYSWEQIKVWAKSIRATGFDGDVVLITYRLRHEEEVLDNCKKLNIKVIKAEHDNWGKPINHNAGGRDTQSHQLRFFHIWQYLAYPRPTAYRWVVVTDVRDVCFQRNPSVWLDNVPHKEYTYASIIAPTEGIQYNNEPWGAENMQRGYGPYFWNFMKEHYICNVGTISLLGMSARDLCLTLFEIGENRYIPNDQSSLNLLIRTEWANKTYEALAKDGWAAQCGTMMDPQKIESFRPHLREKEPVLKNDGYLYPDSSDVPFSLVHQYDRVPQLKQIIESRYQ